MERHGLEEAVRIQSPQGRGTTFLRQPWAPTKKSTADPQDSRVSRLAHLVQTDRKSSVFKPKLTLEGTESPQTHAAGSPHEGAHLAAYEAAQPEPTCTFENTVDIGVQFFVERDLYYLLST